MNREIAIDNTGPIEQLTIPVPDGGGIVVLRGRNGAGKSQAIRATEALLKGKGKLKPRQTAARGHVRGLGAKITVGRAVTRTGELEVVTLDSALNVADLVDPGLINDDAADAKRIKALVTIANAEIDPADFTGLLPPEHAERVTVSVGDPGETDPLKYSQAVKRAFEAQAREIERAIENLKTKRDGKLADLPEIPDGAETDDTALTTTYEDALRRVEQLRGMQAQFEADQEDRIQAANDLRELIQTHSADESRQALAGALAKINGLQSEIDTLNEQIRQLVEQRDNLAGEMRVAVAQRDAAKQAADAANDRQAAIDRLKARLQSNPFPTVAREQIEEAAKATAKAKEALLVGQTYREVLRVREECNRLTEEIDENHHLAELYRSAAAGVDDVLTKAVEGVTDQIRISGGRLVVDTPSRGPTLFAELSAGERWRIALDIALAQCGDHGLLTIPQEAWEGLDPINRAAIARQAKEHGIVIVTAEADAGTIRAEVFNEVD